MALSDVWQDIRKVAAALGDRDKGDRLVSELNGRLEALRQRTASRPSRPSIACVEWIDPLMAAGNWVPELVDVAGGVNLFGEPGHHSGYFGMEQLAAADPDVIAIMPCGFSIDRACREMSPLAEHSEWRRLSAVKARRVFLTDGNQYFNRPGPRVVESAELLAELLHPDSCRFGHRENGWRGTARRTPFFDSH